MSDWILRDLADELIFRVSNNLSDLRRIDDKIDFWFSTVHSIAGLTFCKKFDQSVFVTKFPNIERAISLSNCCRKVCL